MWAHAVRRTCDTQPDVAGGEVFVNDAALDVGRKSVVAPGRGQVAGVGEERRNRCGSALAAQSYRTLSPGAANWCGSGNVAYNALDSIEVALATGSGRPSSTVTVTGSGSAAGGRSGGNGVGGGQRSIGGWMD
jgi:hypothetical protein